MVDDTEDRLEPTLLMLPTCYRIKQIAAGNEFTALLTNDGKLYTFGFNGSGQLGLSNNTSIHSPTQVSLASPEEKIADVVAANGCEHSILVTKDGTAYSTGYNNYGQLGVNSQTNMLNPTLVQELKEFNIKAAACSYYHTIFVGYQNTASAPGKTTHVFSCGRNENGQVFAYSSHLLAGIQLRNSLSHS